MRYPREILAPSHNWHPHPVLFPSPPPIGINPWRVKVERREDAPVATFAGHSRRRPPVPAAATSPSSLVSLLRQCSPIARPLALLLHPCRPSAQRRPSTRVVPLVSPPHPPRPLGSGHRREKEKR
uniref:Uncharacterized protein n=1 Tax=Oryza sativa subsp. japonica TaxID=39947 RepID=Q5JND3_ORYSJ|nr:hypothetical protein [Oryza sativa Japonica Group]